MTTMLARMNLFEPAFHSKGGQEPGYFHLNTIQQINEFRTSFRAVAIFYHSRQSWKWQFHQLNHSNHFFLGLIFDCCVLIGVIMLIHFSQKSMPIEKRACIQGGWTSLVYILASMDHGYSDKGDNVVRMYCWYCWVVQGCQNNYVWHPQILWQVVRPVHNTCTYVYCHPWMAQGC